MPTAQREELIFASFLAPNIRPVYEFIARRVGEELGRPAKLVTGESFGELRTGKVDFAFVCGLPYVRLRREDPSLLEAIAAPIVVGDRYAGKPTYFSDVIVPAAGVAASFEDLGGASWAYNEPNSHSGYLITLFHLLRMGTSGSFFGHWEKTGFHEESIRRVAAGLIDGSAVDSQVLAVELLNRPRLAQQIRIIGTLGPSTIQPLVATRWQPDSVRADVQRIVTGLGEGQADRALLARVCVDRFTPVEDSSYDDIRRMLEQVENAGLLFDPGRGSQP